MALGLVGLIALNIGLFSLSRVLRRHVTPNQKPLETPTATEGRPLPVVYGLQTITPNTGWWGRTTTVTDSSFVTYSYAKMALPLCLGPITAIHDFQFGGKSCALHPITKRSSGQPTVDISLLHWGNITESVTPTLPVTLPTDGSAQEFYVAAQDMFGDSAQQGGVAGVIRVYAGAETQDIDPLFTEEMGADRASGYPHQAFVILGAADSGAPYDYDAVHTKTRDGLFYFGANITAPQPLQVVVQRIPTGLLDLGLDADYTSASIGTDANPAEVIYDLWTNPVCGRGMDGAALDRASLVALAITCAAEGRGVSLTVEERVDPLDVIDAVLSHIHGVRYTDVETGLVTFTLLRNDYTLADCPEVSTATADDIVIAFPGAVETVNEVKVSYHRYDPGTRGPITGETLTTDLRYTGGFALLQTVGRNISDITLYDDGVVIDPADYDAGNQTRGIILLHGDSGVAEGSTITIDYTADPTFIGYRDAESAPVPNIANQQMTGTVRSETYDRPYFTTDANAAWAAALQMQLVGRPLATLSCVMHRTNPLVKPGSVVRVTRPDLGMVDVAFRVDPADYGTLTGGRVKLSAIEDVWAADKALPLPPGEGSGGSVNPPTCPAMAISYVADSAIRIGLFPSDQTFTIELHRADDGAGTGDTLLSDTIAGTTAYYDDAQSVGTTKYYRARLIRSGWTAGAWTAWQAMTAAAGTPTTTPPVVLPTLAYTPSTGGGSGTITLTITDPQGRVQAVRFRHRSGTGAFSAWAVDTSPYADSVTLDGTYDSRIEWEVDYLDADGNTATLTGGYDFEVVGSAPADPDYLVKTATTSLTNERVVTDTSEIAVDWSTAGQAKFGLVLAGPTKGGTGLSSYAIGDLLYASATNTLSKLTGNTTTTKKFLTQTGTGSASAAPAWGTIGTADLGTGTADATTFLRGDLTWATPAGGGGSATFSGCRVRRSSDLTLTNGVETMCDFDTEDYDTDTYHSTVSNTTRLTAPSTGYYMIMAEVRFGANNTNHRFIAIRKNGTTYLSSAVAQATSGGQEVAIGTHCVVALTAGDYVELSVLQNSGLNIAVRGVAEYSPHMEIVRLGT